MSQIGPFWEGDHPLNAVELEVETDDDLSAYTDATVRVIDGTGTQLDELTAVFDDAALTITFSIPTDLDLTSGIWRLVPMLSGNGGVLRLRAVYMVVQADDGWNSLDSLRDATGDDFTLNDQQAATLLSIAKQQVIAFAPALADDAPVPDAYVQAQLMQARNILNSAKTDPQTADDGTQFVIRPFPLDNFVKTMLRPRRGVPVIA